MSMIMLNINDLYKDDTLKQIAPILKNREDRIDDTIKFLRMFISDNDIYSYLAKIEEIMKEKHEDGIYYFSNEDWFFFGNVFNKNK